MSTYTSTIQQMYVAYFNRPADVSGLANWEAYAAGKTLAAVKSALSTEFAKAAEYTIVFNGMTTSQIVTKVYQNLLGRDPDVGGLTNWINHLADGSSTIASLVTDVIRDAGAGDVDTIANKVAAAQAFTAALDTVSEINAYSGAAANLVASTWLSTVGSTAASLTAATTAAALTTVTAGVVSGSSSSAGTTFTLTSGVDTPSSTVGNDTYVADNTSAAAKQLSVADQINGGAGTDTLKVYLKSDDITTGSPALTSIETLYLNGGNIRTLDLTGSTYTGVTSLVIDGAILNDTAAGGAAAAGAVTYTIAGQAVTLSNSVADNSTATVTAGTETTTIASTTDTTQNITVSKYASVSTGTTPVTATQTLDLAGTKVATLNLTSTGGTNSFILTNSGAALTALNIAGDKAVTVTESLANLKTVNASTATGNVTVDTSGVSKLATFAFTGGAGNDKLTVAAGDLALLTAASQLDGGAGTDTLVIKDTVMANTALNTIKNFEVLGLGVTGATVDAALLTSIKSFSIGVTASTETINNLGTGSSVAITAATTAVNLGAAVGNTATDITLGATTTAGFTSTGLTTTGLTSVTLTSNGTSVNTISTLSNSDNTTLTVKGANDLTITNALAGTTTGSKVDASAATGKLSVIGSTKNDTLIGGSAADTLQGAVAGTANQADTLTGGAGADKFVFTSVTGATFFALSAGTSAVTKITDFVAGLDKFDFITTGTAFSSATVANAQTIATAADLTAVYAGITAIAASTATAASTVVVTVSAGGAAGTYLYVNDATAGVSNTADMLVNITGVSGTITAADFIFA
jgi:hypothetical protein